MKSVKRVLSLISPLMLTACLAATSLAMSGPFDHHKKPDPPKPQPHTAAMPEGGSSLVYLGIAGFACLGAVLFTRRHKDGVES